MLIISTAPNVRYEVKIQAVNELGAGEFSNTTDFSTSESGKMYTNRSIHDKALQKVLVDDLFNLYPYSPQ